MSILQTLTIKNLKLNKKRTIVTIIGIMLATALIVALSSLVFSFRASIIESEKYTSGDYHFKFSNVPKNEIQYIENNRNIEKTCIVQKVGYASLEDSKNGYRKYLYLQSFSRDAMDNLGIHLIDGRLPENENEIVISNLIRTEARVKYDVGDTLTLSIGNRICDGYELNENNPKNEEEHLEEKFIRTYKIVGIMERPLSVIEPYTVPGYTIITYLDRNCILDEDNFDVYVRYTKEGLKNYYKSTANILETDEQTVKNYENGYNVNTEIKYEFSKNAYLLHYETMDFSDSTLSTIYGIAAIVIAIIIVTSVFCIRNSFAISITEKVKQYGMLASVGATSKQIKKNVYFESFVLALIGIPLGIILGLTGSFILIRVCNVLLKDSLNIELVYKFSLLAILASLVLSVITCVLSARSSAKRASKISPIDAIRESSDIKIKAKKVKSPKLIKKLFGIGGDIAYKNLKRNSKKYRTTVISIIVCVAVFIATSSFVDLAFKTVKIEIAEIDYNIGVSGNIENIDNFLEKLEEISTFENINKYTIQREISIYANNLEYSNEYIDEYAYDNNYKHPSVYSIGKEEYQRYIRKIGSNYEKCKDKAILINNIVKEKLDEKGNIKKVEVKIYNNKKGDIIKGGINSENNKNIELEICAVTSEKPMSMRNNFGTEGILIVSDEFMDKYKDDIIPYVYMYIDSSNADKLQDDIDIYLNDYGNYNIENINQNMKAIQSLFLIISIFLYGFITVIALIGITNIFNTITTSMELRAKEFAMLKSVGMTKKEFDKMIKLESLFYGSKSLIIGIPIGIALSHLLFKALLNNGMIEFTYQLPLKGIVISLIAVFLLVWSIMRFSLNKIDKQNIIETIRRDNI